MAMRSLVGKLKVFTGLVPRSSGGLPKARALPAMIDEQMKRDWDQLQRRLKAQDRVRFATVGAVLGVTLYAASCFIDALLEED